MKWRRKQVLDWLLASEKTMFVAWRGAWRPSSIKVKKKKKSYVWVTFQGTRTTPRSFIRSYQNTNSGWIIINNTRIISFFCIFLLILSFFCSFYIFFFIPGDERVWKESRLNWNLHRYFNSNRHHRTSPRNLIKKKEKKRKLIY